MTVSGGRAQLGATPDPTAEISRELEWPLWRASPAVPAVPAESRAFCRVFDYISVSVRLLSAAQHAAYAMWPLLPEKHMEDSTFPSSILKSNLVDKTAESATKAVDATKSAAAAVLDSVSDKVESVRSTLSPALNNASAPLDALAQYTREKPLVALAAAAGAGAVMFALLRARRSRD